MSELSRDVLLKIAERALQRESSRKQPLITKDRSLASKQQEKQAKKKQLKQERKLRKKKLLETLKAKAKTEAKTLALTKTKRKKSVSFGPNQVREFSS